MTTRWRGDRGDATLEMVIAAGVLMMFVSAMIFAGRLVITKQSVDAAAGEAARVASLARQPGLAKSQARAAGEASLRQQGLDCVTTDVSVDTGDFAKAPGFPGEVSATVQCRVNLADLALPGVPGSRLITASAVSPLDTYRQ